MTRAEAAAVVALHRAGMKMSNLCFNLSQQPTNLHAKEMRELYQEWDKAKLAVLPMLAPKKKERTK